MVLAAFLAMVVALGTLVASAHEGVFQEIALGAASHTFAGDNTLGSWQDILAF